MSGPAAVAAAVRAYDDQPRGVRFHVRTRVRTCPFAELCDRTPRRGRILDVGCGHGVLAVAMALGSGDRQVTGVDIDVEKLQHGRQAAAHAGLVNLAFHPVDADWTPDGSWDAIVLADVLYLMGAEAATTLLVRLADRLAPGGVLLVKEIDVHPRWKYQLARFQELVSTRVTRITAGVGVDFLPPQEIVTALSSAGLRVEQAPLHRRRIHPHHLVMARRD